MTAGDAAFPATPLVPVSWGEVIDKLTILDIKQARMTDADALAHVRRERAALADIAAAALAADPGLAALRDGLHAVNERLWEIEDRIRDKERARRFDEEFVALARQVYRSNDERARIKRAINMLTGSALREEKSYAPYDAAPGEPADPGAKRDHAGDTGS